MNPIKEKVQSFTKSKLKEKNKPNNPKPYGEKVNLAEVYTKNKQPWIQPQQIKIKSETCENGSFGSNYEKFTKVIF